MNTQNINGKTATRESYKRWGENHDGAVQPAIPFNPVSQATLTNVKEKNMFSAITESAAYPAVNASAEAERAYWLGREKAAVCGPDEIDVHRFHDALGRMYPLNWASSAAGECETFMSAEMYCGNVTEIFTRIGIRYFRMRNYSNLNHAQIVERVKEVFYPNDNCQK